VSLDRVIVRALELERAPIGRLAFYSRTDGRGRLCLVRPPAAVRFAYMAEACEKPSRPVGLSPDARAGEFSIVGADLSECDAALR